MTGRVVEWLFVITGVLMAPVLATLVAMMAASLWMLGGLAREAWDRRRTGPAWRRSLAEVKNGHAGLEVLDRIPLAGYPGRFRVQIEREGRHEATAKKALDDLEIDMARRLSWLSFATRVGPMLGLVGTLLPLGPALRGLASEDLGTLAQELEIAFTSTVFGLLIGGLTYAAGVIRRNWYDQDISDLEFLLDTSLRAGESSSSFAESIAEASNA